MKFKLSESNNTTIKPGSVVTLASCCDESVEIVHLQILESPKLSGDVAYHLLNMDEHCLVPIVFNKIEEIYEYLTLATELEGDMIIRVTSFEDIEVTLN